MQIDINKLLHSLIASSWLLPMLGALGWWLKKYVSEGLVTKQSFDNLVNDVDERLDTIETKARENDRDLYEKNREIGLAVAEIKGRLES